MSSAGSRPAGNVTYDHRGRVVLVTGGCHGIGRSICDEFLRAGASVVCADINKDSMRQMPPEIHCVICDVGNELECRNAVESAIQRFGTIDVLVNNAAIQPRDSYVPLTEMDSELYQRMVNVNFSGYVFMAKHVLPLMTAQKSGVIVNIASGQGHRTARQVPVYGPIKAANILQAMQWGVEYARDGVRVVSVSPGAIDTPLVRAALEVQGGARELANRHPLGRIGKPEEVARAVLWLTSSDASFVTATDLAVDGGLGAFAAFADPYPMPSNDLET
ncbi:MAG: SDR family NAD(P)-dependent oxidoreductase [Planctomyces sp.]